MTRLCSSGNLIIIQQRNATGLRKKLFEAYTVHLYLKCFNNSLQKLGFNVWFGNNDNTTQGCGGKTNLTTNRHSYTFSWQFSTIQQMKPLEMFCKGNRHNVCIILLRDRDMITSFLHFLKILILYKSKRITLSIGRHLIWVSLMCE